MHLSNAVKSRSELEDGCHCCAIVQGQKTSHWVKLRGDHSEPIYIRAYVLVNTDTHGNELAWSSEFTSGGHRYMMRIPDPYTCLDFRLGQRCLSSESNGSTDPCDPFKGAQSRLRA